MNGKHEIWQGKFYRLTRTGCKALEAEAVHWQPTTGIIARVFAIKEIGQ